MKQQIFHSIHLCHLFVRILYSYLRYTDRLSGVLFLLLAVILSELHEKPRKQDCVKEKST